MDDQSSGTQIPKRRRRRQAEVETEQRVEIINTEVKQVRKSQDLNTGRVQRTPSAHSKREKDYYNKKYANTYTNWYNSSRRQSKS